MSKIIEYLGIDKCVSLWRQIQHNGGFIQSQKKLFRFDTLKEGTLMGIDSKGNKYYENRALFIGKSRWVEYNEYVGLNYDASQVTPEWFGWLHYKTDYVPHKDPYRPKYPWILEHQENMSGSNEAYMAYSTSKPKIEAWVPPKKNKST